MRISSRFVKNLSKPSHQDPSPSLSLIDETCKNRREETATGEKEAIDRYICPSFVCEILKESEHEAEDNSHE